RHGSATRPRANDVTKSVPRTGLRGSCGVTSTGNSEGGDEQLNGQQVLHSGTSVRLISVSLLAGLCPGVHRCARIGRAALVAHAPPQCLTLLRVTTDRS